MNTTTMDFFSAQARAKKRTSRLIVMFVLAVLGTIVAMYFAAVLIIGQTRGSRRNHARTYSAAPATPLFQPQLLAGVTLTTLAIVGLGSLYKWSQYSAGGKAVAESVGGRRVDPNTQDLQERRLLNVVEEMAIASGVPVPAVYVMDGEPAINAFAAGLTTNDAVVAVTRGTLEKLNRDELQGVVAHEFSHILNGDMRLNLRIAATIFGILALGLIGRGILWSLRNVRVRGKNGGGVVAGILAAGLVMLVVGYVGYFFGRLIQAAVSRQREFLADASAVQFTRNPGGISGALKKIGGFALGSTMQSNQSAAIGHFFFSQAFESGITALWSTHPPLEERIRAIDPTFDGKFFEPPSVIDVAHESFAAAGLAGNSRPATERGAAPQLPLAAATSAIGSIGKLTPEQITNAQLLLDATPARLRAAAHKTDEARALIYCLVLSDDNSVRARQRQIIERRNGGDVVAIVSALENALPEVRDQHRLPLVQLATPVLRELPVDQTQSFLGTLDELIRADGEVTAFEFSVQRILSHTLAIGRAPRTSVVQYYSFQAVVPEINTVLSVLARSSTTDAAAAPAAFAAGAAQIKLIEAKLGFDAAASVDLERFDAALDKLASASLPIKQRTLVAAAHVVQADGQVLVCEFELLRAVSATLDVPMPPLAVAAAAPVSV